MSPLGAHRREAHLVLRKIQAESVNHGLEHAQSFQDGFSAHFAAPNIAVAHFLWVSAPLREAARSASTPLERPWARDALLELEHGAYGTTQWY